MTGSSAPLRCVIISSHGGLGGSERWLLSLLENTVRLDAHVILLQDGQLREQLEKLNVAVSVLPTGPAGSDIARTFGSLTSLLRTHDPEVVLVNGVKAAAVGAPPARWLGVPVVWAKHDFSFDRSIAPWLARLCDAVIATSDAVGEAAMSGRVSLIPPGRPARPSLARPEARALWESGGEPFPDGPVLAMVGRLVAYKGVDTAVRALSLAPGWNLVVAGGEDPSEPGERSRLLTLGRTLGVSERVHLIGEVDGIGGALSAVDAVAVLTRQIGGFGREGYSLVALEALAAGVPLIGAEGNPEVVRMAAAGGLVVPSDDPIALAAAMDSIAREEDVIADPTVITTHPDTLEVADRVVAVLAQAALRPGAGLEGPSLSVLTCFRNEAGHIDGVVGAVTAQLGPDDEYLLLDDCSEDDTPAELQAWARRDHRIRLLSGPGVNLSAARNYGFEEARHDIVACTDAGVLPAATWLDHLRAPFAEREAVDLVVGSYEVDGGTPLKEAARAALFPDPELSRRRTPIRRLRARLLGRDFSASRLDGRSMACTVDAWRQAGRFDEALFSSEDAAFGYAVQNAGGRSVLALDAKVIWEQAETLREMASMYQKYGYWGGRAGSAPLVVKDLARVAGLLALVGLAVSGENGAKVAAVAGGAYLTAPMVGAVAAGVAPGSAMRIPGLVLLKDASKAAGCVRGLVARFTSGAEAT